MTLMLLEWVITSVFLILTVLALRAAFGKRVSARLRYALWAVVLARLLVPVHLFTSPLAGTRFFSESRTEQTVTQWPITSDTHVAFIPNDGLSLNLPDAPPLTNFPAAPQAPEPPTVPVITPAAPDLTKAPVWLGWVWLGGSIALALVLAASNLRFALRLRRGRIPLEGAECPLPVYVAVGLPSPCLFGLARPAVYVTPEATADPVMLRHVLAHEYTHFRQGDHLWSLLRCAALAAHWWNPLVWLAVTLSRRDGELSCDEGALKRLGDDERLAYGNTLLALVTAKPGPGDLLCFATTMAGEKKSLKERVSRIAHAPKRWLWAAVAVVLVTALACACAFGSAEEPNTADGPDADPTPSATGGPDAELPEFTPTYTVECDGAVQVGGLDGAFVEWSRGTNGGALYLFGNLRFCCPRLADERVEGNAFWADGKKSVLYVHLNVNDDRIWSSTIGGIVISFSVDLDSDKVTIREFTSELGDRTIELADQEMIDMARALARLLTEAEDYYQSLAGWLVNFDSELQTDLDRDGIPETIQITELDDGYGLLLELRDSGSGDLIWSEPGYFFHMGQNSVFLCTLDGKDYLLRYSTYMALGNSGYYYQLFTLTRDGQEQVVQTNSVWFDVNFDYPTHRDRDFDPEAIAAFMDEINGLLAHSVLLINTDSVLMRTFQKEGRLYDSLGWLDDLPVFVRDETASLLENLTQYKLRSEHSGFTVDLNRNGVPETVQITQLNDGAGQQLELWEGGKLIFSEAGYYAHAGWNALFLYTLDGKDYLLRYHPYMGQGWCNYSYELFTLTRDGQEQMVRQNSIEFDINFGLMHESFDPEAIAAFMDEVNGLLAHSIQLINTDSELLDTFQKRGRLYDNLSWLDLQAPVFVRNETESLLKNLTRYKLLMERSGFTVDLNRNGVSEMVNITQLNGGAGQQLEIWEGDELIFSEAGYFARAGANALFLCTLDGKDYLLRYRPYMAQGMCDYSYELFTLENGVETVVQKNYVSFDVNFGSPIHVGFDPEAIAAFMDEVNGLLAHSVQLINTDDELLRTFQEAGRLYDGRWWLDPSVSMLESLRAYQSVMEASYRSVLLGTSTFVLFQDEAGYFLSIDDVPALICQDDPYAMVNGFAVVDMDGDGSDEVLVWVCGISGDTSGYLLLHRENGAIYGTVFNAHNNWSNRWFNDLKTDGTFECSDILDRWSSVSKLFFTAGSGTGIYGLTVIRNDPDYDLESFMTIQNEVAQEEDWQAAVQAQREKPDAMWYELNEATINDVFKN